MQMPSELYSQLLQIWTLHFDNNADVWMPFVPAPIHPAPLLFVGLNPSFGKGGFRRILASMGHPEIRADKFFDWRNRDQFKPHLAQEIEKRAREEYAYFKIFNQMAKDLGVGWEHIDLFFYRETSQKDCKDLFWKDDNLTGFGHEQIELSKRLIAEVDPKVIVVANAFASDIAAKEFPCIFDEEHGYHITHLTGNPVPTFLGSMLNGQRAMDRYSRQRLLWHINKALKSVSRLH